MRLPLIDGGARVPSCVVLHMKTEDPSPTLPRAAPAHSLTERRAKSSGAAAAAGLVLTYTSGGWMAQPPGPGVRDRDPEGGKEGWDGRGGGNERKRRSKANSWKKMMPLPGTKEGERRQTEGTGRREGGKEDKIAKMTAAWESSKWKMPRAEKT